MYAFDRSLGKLVKCLPARMTTLVPAGCADMRGRQERESLEMTGQQSSEFVSSRFSENPDSNTEAQRWLAVIDCSSRGPGFNSQHPHGGSQLSVTLVLGDPTSSHASKTPMHIE